MALVTERFTADGFVLVKEAAAAPNARRVVVHADRGWCAFADAAWTDPAGGGVAWTEEEWATYLSTKLGEPVLTLWTWDGEASVLARRFEGKKQVARLELLSDATRGKDGRACAPAEVFAPWLAKKKGKAPKLLVLEDEADPEDAEDLHVYVSLEDSIGAIAAAIDLPRPWINPHDPDPDAGDRVLVFMRPAATSDLPLLPPAVHAKGFDARAGVRSYGRRDFAVGWVAFDGRAGLTPLDAVVAPLVEVLCPSTGYEIRVTRGRARQSLARRFSPSSRISAAQLQRGGAIELSYGSPDVVGPGLPLLWVAHQPGGTPVEALDVPAKAGVVHDAVPFVFGWCIPATGNAQGEHAITEVMEAAVVAAANLAGCIGAFLTAQGDGVTYGDSVLAYERLAETSAGAGRAAWLSGHVRAPGWLVLVPGAAAKRLPDKSPAGVRVTKVPAGVLVRAEGKTPYAQGELRAVERYLLSVVGTQAELARTGD